MKTGVKSFLGKFSLLSLLFLTSCVSDEAVPTATNDVVPITANAIIAGDLIVTNSTNDSLHLLDSDGNFKKVLYDVENTSNIIYGVTWKSDSNEILFTVDGSDRVMAVSVVDGTVRTFIENAYLNGSLRGLTQLNDGSFLIIESNNIEKFTSQGVRVTNSGVWPKNLGSVPEQIFTRANGGFGICFRGSDEVRLFDDDGTQTHSVASGIAGTTDSYGCTELANGNIAAGWLGTTDTIRVYNSTLSSVVSSFTDTGILTSPRGMDQNAAGNLLVLDSSYHQIYEINPSDGTFVRVMGGATLSGPAQILVIPNY